MKKVFTNKTQVQLVFTDEGIGFYDSRQEMFFPYGSIDTLHMSLLGILQVTHLSRVCTFAVNSADRADVKTLIRSAKEAMAKAERTEPRFVDLTKQAALVDAGLSSEEQLRQYKTLFIQGIITREEYNAKKQLLKG